MAEKIKTSCRVCSGKFFSAWGERDGLPLYQCDNCELVFFYPYPSQEELAAYYNDKYHEERGYGGAGEAGQLRRRMYELDIMDLEGRLGRQGRFLDVGCAEGIFLSMLDSGWEKTGIDISRQAVDRAKQKEGVKAEVKDISEMVEGYFDVIHLRGVFEHLLNPMEFVRNANAKLRDNGCLVLSNTPNIGGPVPHIFRGRFKLVIPREHVNYFSLNTMETLAKLAGFTVQGVKYPYFGSPYCSLFKDLLQIPVNYLTGKMSPPFWGNIFTVYMRKQGELS